VSQFDDPNREALGLDPISTGAGAPDGEQLELPDTTEPAPEPEPVPEPEPERGRRRPRDE